ncbi:MAG: ABC transporter permease [Bacillota bacterium]
MRKVFAITRLALTRMGRDRKALIIFLLMPMILIGILGVSLKDLMSLGKIHPFTVVLVDEDQPPPGFDLGQVLVDQLFGSPELQELITLQPGADLAAARQRVERGEVAAVIHLPAGLSEAVLEGKPAELGLYTDPGRPTQADIVAQILGIFTDQVTRGAVAAALAGPEQAAVGIELPEIRERPSTTREVGAMAYYAAGMAVMYMLMSAAQRAKTILEDRQNGTLARIMISPTPPWAVLAGLSLSTAVLIGAQFLILLVGTTLLYGVHWGPWIAVIPLGLSFAVAAAGISTGLAALFRDPRTADTAVGLLGMIFGALSGSMFPLYAFPEGLLRVAKAIPNYWALQGFLDQMAGVGIQHAALPIAILCITGLTTGALGAWRLATR